MGFLKKIFKPVSKVLDKIIPNEIKPALPYLAAFAPVFGPTAGMFGSTMGKRMLLSGGANILGQLSQEGSEGDINLLSAGLGALTGAMTTPGAAETFQGMKTPTGSYKGVVDGVADTVIKRPELSFLDQAKNFGLEGLSKGSNILRPEGGIPDLFSKAGAKAALLPASTATGDVMEASARQLEKQNAIDEALAAAELLEDSGARAAAIRNAMNAYGFFTDEEIDDTIFSAGYANGGRVGFEIGGLGALGGAMEKESEYIPTLDDIKVTLNQVYTTAGGSEDGSGYDAVLNFMSENPEYKVEIMENMIGDKGDQIRVAPLQKESINILDSMDGSNTITINGMDLIMPTKKAKGGRVGLRFGGIGDAVENIEDEEIKESAKFAMNDMDIPIMDLVEEFEITFKRKPNSLEELKQFYRDRYDYKGPGDVKMQEEIKEKVVMEAKDGGLMNLGGKEMDMRGGGFIPIGKKERADDVPARLSKNEFVMTADAVRAAGGGSVNEGAKRMYETMNKLEARA